MGIKRNLEAYAGHQLAYKYNDGAMDAIKVEIEMRSPHPSGTAIFRIIWRQNAGKHQNYQGVVWRVTDKDEERNRSSKLN